MLPGVIGTIQANEALKIVVGYGEALVGRYLTFDAQTTTFGELKLRRDPACPTCGNGWRPDTSDPGGVIPLTRERP